MKQVLFVEDSSMSQVLMRRYLEGMCELTIRGTISAGMEAIKERRFDLIMVDFLFPDGDSLIIIDHVRRTEPAEKLPIIVVTASLDRALLARVLRAGANDAVTKPIQVEPFRLLVSRMLSQPFVRSLDNTVQSISCFEWHDRDAYHQYCPQLQLAVSGTTKLQASESMHSLLEAQSARVGALSGISGEAVITHLVASVPAAPGKAAAS